MPGCGEPMYLMVVIIHQKINTGFDITNSSNFSEFSFQPWPKLQDLPIPEKTDWKKGSIHFFSNENHRSRENSFCSL